MIKANLFSHPEIEFRSSLSGVCVKTLGHQTLLDLLEVYPTHFVWKEKLDHAQLLNYFQETELKFSSDTAKPHPLRIFFVEDLNFREGHSESTIDLAANTTAYWFRQRFGVSPLFLDCLKSPTHSVTIGNASFIRRETRGKRVGLDGLYRYSADLAQRSQPPRPPVHVWFSHSLVKGRGSTYIVHQCPEEAKQLILSCANGSDFQSLLRPLAIDIFLAEDCVQKWVQRVAQTRIDLLKYEAPLPQELDHDETAKAVEKLYQLSQLFQIIRDIITDVRDQLDYLVKVHGKRYDDATLYPPTTPEDTDDRSVAESLEFLRSKNQILMRWVVNYMERTQVQIKRFFNNATQQDSSINVNISQLTSKIAVSTQRDSSAMITMAAVTMFFLPGTFISALFSMVFFNTETDATGKTYLSVAPQWWIFPVITIPLTILVFAIWILWWRIRDRKTLTGLTSLYTERNNTSDMEKAQNFYGHMA